MRTAIVSLMVIMLVLTACSTTPTGKVSEPEQIVIGAVLPFTGPVAAYGISAKDSIELVVKDVNAKGGIDGKLLVVKYEDGQCDAQAGASAANRLINVEKVPVIIGGVCSSETLAFTPIAEQNKVVVFSPCASSPELTAAGDYVFRDYPSDGYAGTFAAEFAYKNLRARTAGVIFTNDDYGVGVQESFVKTFTDLGGSVVAKESFMKGVGDYRTQLLRIKQSEPDMIYVVAYPQDGGLIAKQARELGITSEIINSDSGFHEDFVKAAQGSGEGVFVSAAMSRMAPEYVEAYKAEYGSEPQLCGPQAYDIANILVETMRRVGTESSAIKDALYEVRNYPGVAWNVSLDENGDLVGAAFEMNVVRGREFQTYS